MISAAVFAAASGTAAAQSSLPPGVSQAMVDEYLDRFRTANPTASDLSSTVPAPQPQPQALPPAAPLTPQSTNGSWVPSLPVPASRPYDPSQFAPPLPNAQMFENSLEAVPVFGRSLFQGNFAANSFKGFSPEYVVGVGDSIDLRLWGAVDLQTQLIVDAQGNVFVPHVGPIRVSNVKNEDLNQVVTRQVRQTYREDVGVYASLTSSVPVKVFVSGFVNRPGLYPGYAADSILTFIDRAGGINPVSGSYIDVRVLRGGKPIADANLYDFLVKGALPQVQLHEGDSIFIGPIGTTAMVQGLVATPAQFEFAQGTRIVELLAMAGVNARTTNVSISRSQGTKREVIYVPMGDAALEGPVANGDVIEAMADRAVGQIAVLLEGEHDGASQYVLPYTASLGDLLTQVKYSAQSNKLGLQLYRKSVAERQKQTLDEMLQKLEQSVLTARSATEEESQLRSRDATLILQFIQRAKSIVPKGQVILPQDLDPTKIALEDGDVVRIPRESALVQVHGEVFMPNAFVWRKGLDVDDYIKQAGGLMQKTAGDRILLVRPSGEIASIGTGFLTESNVQPGDEIMVLPAVDTKHFQFGKDIIQIIYQIAVAAGVVARL
jgi:protein involved in polysaccharide export with SLBB domain